MGEVFTLVGNDEARFILFKNEDGSFTVAIVKRSGSTKFSCQGSTYVAAHQKAFPITGDSQFSENEDVRIDIPV